MSVIIKAGELKGDDRALRGVAFNFADMSDRANEYLAGVRKEAEKIVAEAKREAEAIRQQASEQGHGLAIEAAVKVLRSDMEQNLQTLMPALQQVVAEVQHARQLWLGQWEKHAIHLATAIAARIIRRELSQDPKISIDWMREALQLAAGDGEMKLYLNPQDLEALGAAAERLTNELGQLAPTTVLADPEISPGGCRVVTRFGAVDQQIEAQLERIEEELAS